MERSKLYALLCFSVILAIFGSYSRMTFPQVIFVNSTGMSERIDNHDNDTIVIYTHESVVNQSGNNVLDDKVLSNRENNMTLKSTKIVIDLSRVKNISNIEAILCQENTTIRNTLERDQTHVSSKKPLCISIGSRCRLGNQMFQYALLYSLKNRGPWTPYIHSQGFRILRATFNGALTLPVDNDCRDSVKILENINADMMLAMLKCLPRDKNITLMGYFQSHKFFSSVAAGIRQEFQFSRETRDDVEAFFANNTESKWEGTKVTRVGIHVRRGDMVSSSRQELGVIPSPVSYFRNAMNYFQERFPRVQFFVATDDLLWCREHIRGRFVVYSDQRYDRDLAMLTMCDHVIISVGTFSWWAGWLCPGITLYHGAAPRNGTYMDMMFANNKWIPPKSSHNNWVPITAA